MGPSYMHRDLVSYGRKLRKNPSVCTVQVIDLREDGFMSDKLIICSVMLIKNGLEMLVRLYNLSALENCLLTIVMTCKLVDF